MKMHIEKTATGYAIYNPSTLIKQKALTYFSLKNPVREFFTYSREDSDHDVLYITSGFGGLRDERLRHELKDYTELTPHPGKKIELTQTREPRSQLQKDCIEKLTTSDSAKITVELKPGVGKAEPYSRKIPVPDSPSGYKLMGELKVGDEVFDKNGNPSYIVGIFEQGEQDVYKVTFSDGREAYCTDQHLWTFHVKNNNEWVTDVTGNIMKYYKHKKCYIPACLPVNYPKRNVPIDPWVFGCFIGNGCLTSDQLQIYAQSDEVPNAISEIYNFKFKKITNSHAYIFFDEDFNEVKTSDFFKDCPELIGMNAHEKKIPECYMYNNVDVRIHLLQGMMDTNGYMELTNSHVAISYTSGSNTLLTQIRELLYSLGYTGQINDISHDNTYYGTIEFEIPNSAKNYVFSMLSKRIYALLLTDKFNYKGFNNELQIVDISYSHRENCRCIMVNNPDHLYLTQDYIVTHNTFISLYSISKLGLKPLIVTPSTLLKNQWIENLTDSGIPAEDIAKSISDGKNKKFTVVTISSIENSMREDFEKTMEYVAEAGYGIKIIDEAHLHLKGLLKFDALCNIKHNWYLSATLGRSDAQEDTILNRALSDADRFIGSAIYEEYQKEYVNIYLQDIIYHPSTKLCEHHFRYGTKGLIRSTYYNMLMDYGHGYPFMNNIIRLIKVARGICPYGKILVLVPLITIIDATIEIMKKDPWFNGHEIVGVDGSMSIANKREALEKEYILSTSMSMGVGVDVADLSCVINFDQYSSPIIGEQIFGRLRTRKDGKETYYFDICDHVKQARQIENWGRKRRVILPYFPGASQNIRILPRISC